MADMEIDDDINYVTRHGIKKTKLEAHQVLAWFMYRHKFKSTAIDMAEKWMVEFSERIIWP